MKGVKYHIFICTSSRPGGQQRGACHSRNSVYLMESFLEGIEERGLGGEVFVTNTGCLGFCDKGPVVIVYPDNVWYGNVSIDDVADILEEHIEGGSIVERLLLRP